MKRILESRFARDTGWVFLMKTVHVGFGFVITVLLARLMGAEGYGVYSFAYAVVILLALPAEAGLPRVLVRETASGEAVRDPGWIRRVWSWSGRMIGVSTFVVVLLAGPALVLWQGGLDEVAGRTMAWAVGLIPLIVLANTSGAALRGLKRIAPGRVSEFVLRPGLFLLILAVVVLAGDRALSPDFSMALHGIAAFLASIAGLVLLWMLTPNSVRGATPGGATKGLMSSTILFALLAGFQVINAHADTVILGLFEAPDQVGIYRVSVQMAILAAFGLHVINSVVAPRFADFYARGEIAALQRLVTAASRFVLAVNVLVTIAILVLGNGFLSFVFGEDFGASFAPLVVLLGGQMVHSAMGSVGNLLDMAGMEAKTASAMAIAAGVNITMNFVLIPIWGLIGAATATAVAMTLWNIILWRRVRHDLGIDTLAFTGRGGLRQ